MRLWGEKSSIARRIKFETKKKNKNTRKTSYLTEPLQRERRTFSKTKKGCEQI